MNDGEKVFWFRIDLDVFGRAPETCEGIASCIAEQAMNVFHARKINYYTDAEFKRMIAAGIREAIEETAQESEADDAK